MIKTIDYNNEAFNSRAEEFNVFNDETSDLISDLKDTLLSLENKVFLCANEIGRKERAFGIRFEDEVKLFFNPVFQDKKDPKLVRELDEVTNKEYIMPRFSDVTICYQDELGKTVATKFKEPASLIVCKAMDFIDGLHDSDFGLEVLPEFDSATDEERQEVIDMYIEYLTNLGQQLDAELQMDEDVKDEWNAYRFAKAKAEGKIETFEDKPGVKLNRAQRRYLKKFKNKLLKVEV